MDIFVFNERNAQVSQKLVIKQQSKTLTLLRTWELYPILLIAAWLRLYHIDTVIFVDDQAVVFQMARDAIVHGLWPITSNRASLGNINFPLVVYFFLLPAAFSSNPLWAEVMVGCCNTMAVVLAYFFMRRYYGRLAAIIVALLYATSVMALAYSGDIWPQNLLPPFVLLFLFSLFRGVVERRRGWFWPALVLLGILYQLHGSSLLLAGLLIVACSFAFKTIRWYEILLAMVLLGIVCTPYLFWEWKSHFSDVAILLTASKAPTHITLDAWLLYKSFLCPYIQNGLRADLLPTDPHSVLVDSPLRYLRAFLSLEYALMPWLLLCSVIAGIVVVLRSARTTNNSSNISGWLRELWVPPYQQGLLLLLIWQIVLPMALLRHSIALYPHYFIIFLPGQFMLIGLFISKVLTIFQVHVPKWKSITYCGMGTLTVCIIGAQLLGSVSALIDRADGNFDGGATFPAYNDLSSMQHVLQEADQIAQERHIHRIYVATNYSTSSAMHYLMEQEKTPSMVFEDWHCMVLPSVSAGSVIFIWQPSDPQVGAIFDHYATMTLVDQPRRLGGAPFNLSILTAKPEDVPATQTFTHDIRVLETHALQIQDTNHRWVVTHWSVTNSEKPATRTFYLTHFDIRLNGKMQRGGEPINCSTTSQWAGDQYFTLQSLGPSDNMPTFVTVQAYAFTSSPLTFPLGPLTLSTFVQQDSPWMSLQTGDGQTSLKLAGS